MVSASPVSTVSTCWRGSNRASARSAAKMTWELRYVVDETAWDAAVHAATQWWFEQARKAAPDSPEVQMLASVFEPEDDSDG